MVRCYRGSDHKESAYSRIHWVPACLQLPRALQTEEVPRKRPNNVSAGDGDEEGLYAGSEETHGVMERSTRVYSPHAQGVIWVLRRGREHQGVRLTSLLQTLCLCLISGVKVQFFAVIATWGASTTG